MDDKKKRMTLLSAMAFIFLSLSVLVLSTPDGVTVTSIGNSTKAASTGTIANYTGGTGLTSGGYIFTINISGDTQNTRWKAFVGNASGKLTLDDADGATIYDWSLTTLTGEVYATRHSGTINWTGIGCAPINATEIENINLSHTSADDNVTATFSSVNNQPIIVGTVTLAANTCRTTNIYQNSTNTVSTQDVFEQVVLYDNGNRSWDQNQSSFGKIVYVQNLETDVLGYTNLTTYDFQMIVPERGSVGWASSTAYYFYLELS